MYYADFIYYINYISYVNCITEKSNIIHGVFPWAIWKSAAGAAVAGKKMLTRKHILWKGSGLKKKLTGKNLIV